MAAGVHRRVHFKVWTFGSSFFLAYLSDMQVQKRTKIVCTIGPASKEPAILEKLIRAGMNVARLNFSHGTYEEHAEMIATIRSVAAKVGEPIGILQDLQGPKIRVGILPKDGVMLVNDEEVIFSTEPDAVLPKISVSYDKLHEDVKVGDVILLDDGLIDVRVLRVSGRDIVCKVVNGGKLTSHKGFNLPTASLKIAAITEKDREDLAFGVSQHVDLVALSFVRDAADVLELRDLIRGQDAASGDGPDRIRLIAKIEKHEAIRNIDSIIEAVDGIMVARGDLGIETPAEYVPIYQKRIIDKCRSAAKPVIVATQMLDSMIRNPRPTRAEVSDVANAVIDHTDAVMLSGESASGKFPVEAVETMSRIIHETEISEFYVIDPARPHAHVAGPAGALAEAVSRLAREGAGKVVVVGTSAGDSVRAIASERPVLPVYATTASERVSGQLALSWGVEPILAENVPQDGLVTAGLAALRKDKRLKPGDLVIAVFGESEDKHFELRAA